MSVVFPLLANLRGRAVRVVGGGIDAERATVQLRRAGAPPLVGAPELTVSTPALLILGAVAAFPQTLHWFGSAPLSALPPYSSGATPHTPTLAHAA